MSNEIDTADITERLVGITPIYLNNFVQRGLFGLKASVQSGKVRAKRRFFSREDVFGIALVWLLFESGLRTDPIIRVLKDITGTARQNANAAAQKLLQSRKDYLLVVRTARPPAKGSTSKPEQSVEMLSQDELKTAIDHNAGANLLIISVGAKFKDVAKRLDILFPS